MMTFDIRPISDVDQMLKQLPLLQLLTADLTESRCRKMLEDMTRAGYQMIGVFDGEHCVGLSGIWIGTKLYSGKYLEIDNFVTHPDYRSKGIGQLLVRHIEQMAQQHHCQCIMLDAYTSNTAAHKFYLREGFVIKGFHFIKSL